MTSQQDKATAFHALHVKGDPVILFNIWDAGSAKAVEKAGAKALATGSRSVAGALGFDDGEALPMLDALANAARIVAATDLPLTLDFEGGYATSPADVAANVSQALDTGVIGFNFEDQILGSAELYSIEDQAARIAAIRKASAANGVNAFINARTDIFLKAPRDTHDSSMVDLAIARCLAYGDAGASGFFIPGLVNLDLVAKICDASPLPVNVMMFPDITSKAELAALGVARISHGPFPWYQAMAFVEENARAALGG
jgi:2-methylisocitrate lyase-like PEP mutase family enzyme